LLRDAGAHIGEALDNEQLQARGMVVEADGLPQLAPPWKLSGYDFGIERAPRRRASTARKSCARPAIRPPRSTACVRRA
jgi:crotonobetainyl-CoA:carnitine CoA-transferase CaiB-like acyl-CoA transferase